MLGFFKAETEHCPLIIGFYNKAQTEHYPLKLGFKGKKVVKFPNWLKRQFRVSYYCKAYSLDKSFPYFCPGAPPSTEQVRSTLSKHFLKRDCKRIFKWP